jgi:hypothetical protein
MERHGAWEAALLFRQALANQEPAFLSVREQVSLFAKASGRPVSVVLGRSS